MRPISNSQLSIFPICLGTGEIGTRIDRKDSFRLLDSYLEQGGNFLDTAHVYGDWVKDIERSICEKTIGAWMKERGVRDKIVLATKGGHFNLSTPQTPRLSPADIMQDLDESLQFLQTDRIDLYWLHRDDTNRPVEEILQTLHEQQQAGKIRYYGASNWKAERLRAAQEVARQRGYNGFVADQVLWNAAVLAKTPFGDPTVGWMDADLFAYHLETGLTAIPFQSQAYGLFNRIHNGTLDQMNPGQRAVYNPEATQARYERMREIMEETGLTITQVVLGYLLSQPFSTVPIVGCRSLEQLADSMSAADVRLTPEQIRSIEQRTGPN